MVKIPFVACETKTLDEVHSLKVRKRVCVDVFSLHV